MRGSQGTPADRRRQSMSKPKIAFAGTTLTGVAMAAAAAAKGFEVVLFDPDLARIASLEAGHLPFAEPDLGDALDQQRPRLTYSASLEALSGCDLAFVCGEVLLDDTGKADCSALDVLLDRVAAVFPPDRPLVVISVVPPGYSRARALQRPGLHVLVDPVIGGRAMERALKPDRLLIGCAEPGLALPPALAAWAKAFDSQATAMQFESAELVRICTNAYLTLSISLANSLAELCEGFGGDWGEIAQMLRQDRRIGQNAYLGTGLGLAGGVLERDLAMAIRLMEQGAADARLLRACDALSLRRRDWALRILYRRVLSRTASPCLAVLGLAYKENTNSTKNSPALALIRHLRRWPIQVFDPVLPPQTANHPNVVGAGDALAACDGADAVAIMTPWPQFRDLDPRRLATAMRGRLLLDPYAVLDADICRMAGLEYHCLGRRPQAAVTH